jgi:hypothetical protein
LYIPLYVYVYVDIHILLILRIIVSFWENRKKNKLNLTL